MVWSLDRAHVGLRCPSTVGHCDWQPEPEARSQAGCPGHWPAVSESRSRSPTGPGPVVTTASRGQKCIRPGRRHCNRPASQHGSTASPLDPGRLRRPESFWRRRPTCGPAPPGQVRVRLTPRRDFLDLLHLLSSLAIWTRGSRWSLLSCLRHWLTRVQYLLSCWCSRKQAYWTHMS